MKTYLLYFVLILVFINSSCARRTGRRAPLSSLQSVNSTKGIDTKLTSKSIVKMKQKDGVYFIPCIINNTPMDFIFDTGASDITMSQTEALFLYKQGTLKDKDFIGTQKYQIANGQIEAGTVINLTKVQIGNRTLKNVRASIVHNNVAPLLLGQSALSQFGIISIDYRKEVIIFE